MGDYAQGKLPLFERMIELDPSDMAYALALKANSLYAALTPASLAAAGTNVGENDTTAPVYNMLRDWKFTELWAERAILSFRRTDTEGQVQAIEWIISLMRTCKTMGNLHHASALLAALKNPAIIRLPEVEETLTIHLHKKQVLQTAELITKETDYNKYLDRRRSSKTATTPILRYLMDYLRDHYARSGALNSGDESSATVKNQKLIKMFASFNVNVNEAGPSQRIEKFLAFQTFDFDTALKKKSMKRRSEDELYGVGDFLRQSYTLGEQTYEQPTLIISLSHRLLPWPEVFPADGSAPTPTRTRQLHRLQSSLRLTTGRIRAPTEEPLGAKPRMSLTGNESPITSLIQCLWGTAYATQTEKRDRVLALLDDLVLYASQRASQFPLGEWEAVLIESLAILQPEDGRAFRLLIITESTLLNWHFENRPSGMAVRLRSTFEELVSCFGNTDDTTDVQRLILFSLCSRITHHLQEFRHDIKRPQWGNLRELTHVIIQFVFLDESPLIFANADALYLNGQCLDEGLMLICEDIIRKLLRNEADEAAMAENASSDEKANFKRNLASLKADLAVFKVAIETLTQIKQMKEEDRQTQMFAVVKPLRTVLAESTKTYGKTGATSRFRNLMPFKSSAAPAATRSDAIAAARKRFSVLTRKEAADPSMTSLRPSAAVGELARGALSESIERHRNQRDVSPRIAKRSTRSLRRKSFSGTSSKGSTVAVDLVTESRLSPDSAHGTGGSVAEDRHRRRRSSFPDEIISPPDLVKEIVQAVELEGDDVDDDEPKSSMSDDSISGKALTEAPALTDRMKSIEAILASPGLTQKPAANDNGPLDNLME